MPGISHRDVEIRITFEDIEDVELAHANDAGRFIKSVLKEPVKGSALVQTAVDLATGAEQCVGIAPVYEVQGFDILFGTTSRVAITRGGHHLPGIAIRVQLANSDGAEHTLIATGNLFPGDRLDDKMHGFDFNGIRDNADCARHDVLFRHLSRAVLRNGSSRSPTGLFRPNEDVAESKRAFIRSYLRRTTTPYFNGKHIHEVPLKIELPALEAYVGGI